MVYQSRVSSTWVNLALSADCAGQRTEAGNVIKLKLTDDSQSFMIANAVIGIDFRKSFRVSNEICCQDIECGF